MTSRDAADFDINRFGPAESYSTRPRNETSAGVVRNRFGITAILFGVAMSCSYLLGRRAP